jgi:large repetitive protein
LNVHLPEGILERCVVSKFGAKLIVQGRAGLRAIFRPLLAEVLVFLLFLQPIVSDAQDVAATSIRQYRASHAKVSAKVQPTAAVTSGSLSVPTAISAPAAALPSPLGYTPVVSPQINLSPQLANLAKTVTPANAPVNGSKTTTRAVSLPAGAKTGTATPDSTKSIISHVVNAKPKIVPADTTDPYIIAQAAALGNNVSQIFAFVRDQIGSDIYMGSVRGARGTLWTKAGNSLDKASLLIALLGAAGVSAQYVQGTLSQTQIQNLILQMFPTYTQVLGCPTYSTILAQPQYDGTLQNDLTNYFWVEYGTGNTALDANIAGSQPGQTFGTQTATFTTIPDSMRQQITLRLNAEIYSQASQAIAQQALSTTTVLQQTFYTDTLTGRPITVGNLVNENAISALIISSTTITYSPYFLLGQGDTDITQDPIVYGNDFQEVYTNFPLGSQMLTGLFLEVDTQNPNFDITNVYPAPAPIVTDTRTIFDRIGYAARQGLTTVNVSSPNPIAPALTGVDLVTVNALPGFQSQGAFSNQLTRIGNLNTAIQTIQPQVEALPTSNLTAAQLQLQAQGTYLSRLLAAATNELTTMTYYASEDYLVAQLQQEYLSRAYYTTPRVTLGVSQFLNNSIVFGLDLLVRDIRFEEGPQQTSYASNQQGQNDQPSTAFEVQRGVVDSDLEAVVLTSVTGQQAFGIHEILNALNPGEVPLLFTAANIDGITNTTLSPDAQARIQTAVSNNKAVITPSHMVTINGQQTVGWYEMDETTGETVSAFPNGGHQAIVSATGLQILTDIYTNLMASLIGYVSGFGVAGYAFAAAALSAVSGGSYLGALKQAKNNAGGLVSAGAYNDLSVLSNVFSGIGLTLAALKSAIPVLGGPSLLVSLVTNLAAGIHDALTILGINFNNDPDAPLFMTSPLGPLPAGTTPGATPAANLTLNPDTLLTTPYNGLSLPINDRLVIQNTGPTDTFNISGYAAGAYAVTPSQTNITIPGGQTATVGVCVVPATNQAQPPPGTMTTLELYVSDTSGTVQLNTAASITTPSLPSIQLTATPLSFNLAPGASTPATVTLTGTGNANPGTVSLATTLPTGITLTGLPSTVSLTDSQVANYNLTLAVASGTAPGTYTVDISASLSGTVVESVALQVQVATVGTCTANASNAAAGQGAATLAAALLQLATDEGLAAQNPSNPLAPARLSGDLLPVIDAMTTQYLQTFVTQLQAEQTTLAAATPANLLSAISALDAILCNVNTTLTQASDHNFIFSIMPNQQVASATQPAVYTLNLQESGAAYDYETYNIAVGALPAGVTATITNNDVYPPVIASSVQLTPYQVNANLSVSITSNASSLVPINFTVTATPTDAPQFARTITGSLTVAPEVVNVDNVTVTDTTTNTTGLVNTGDPAVIKARVYGVVNQSLTGQIIFNIYNTAGTNVDSFEGGIVTLTPDSAPQVLTVANLATSCDIFACPTLQGLPSGVYKVVVTVQSTPQASGTGYFVLGAPVSANLTATPTFVNPPSATVTTTLTLTRDTVPNPEDVFLGSAATTGASYQIILNPVKLTDAYVCSSTNITRVDVTNPASPVIENSFGSDATVLGSSPNGYGDTPCAISPDGSHLYLLYSRPEGSSAIQLPTNIATYDISNPAAPVLDGVTGVDHPDADGLAIVGGLAFTTAHDVFYCPICGDAITQQNGDYLVFNISNPASPVYDGDLFPTTPDSSGFTYGGPNEILGLAQLSATTALLTSSTSTGANVGTGVGNLLSVSATTPSAPTIVAQTQVPGTRVINSIAVQGNLALVTGDTEGYTTAVSGYVGNLTLTVFNIANPNAPVLLQTLTTGLTDPGSASVVSLGGYMFAAGGADNNGQNVILFIDATQFNPANNVQNPTLRYIPYDVATPVYPSVSNGNIFYATTPNGISIYQLGTVVGPQLNVTLQVPTGTGVSVVANSFNPAPTTTTPGTGSTTYYWQQPSVNTITFQENVTGMQPGVPVAIVTTGSVNFVEPTIGNGSIPLGPLEVLPEQILNISPGSQNVTAGQQTSFTVTVSNPSSSAVTYTLSVTGIPQSWFTPPASINVPANGSSNVQLNITPTLAGATGTGAGSPTFTVSAVGANGLTGSVTAQLYIQSDQLNVGTPNTTDLLTQTLELSSTPSTITIGRGQTLQANLVLGNPGTKSLPAPYIFFTGSIPQLTGACVVAASCYYPATPITVPVSGTQVVPFTMTAAAGAPLGLTSLVATVYPNYSVSGESTSGVTLKIPVNIVANGVQASITGQGTSGSPYQLVVQNTGTVNDTYTLAPTGVFAGITTLGSTSVAVNAGQQKTVSLSLGAYSGLAPGTYQLTVTATSQAVPAVFSTATTSVIVSSLLAVTAQITPNPAQTTNGSAPLELKINNSGNIDDSYSVTISKLTGGLQASLNLPNQPATESITQIRVGGLGSAVVPMVGTLASGSGTVTVTLVSLTSSSVSTTATATVTSVTTKLSPTANAGTGSNIPLHRIAILNGSGSSDTNSPPLALTYAWTLVSAPTGSSVTTASIGFPTNPEAVFRPDVAGSYSFKLTVTNSVGSTSANVTYNAQIFPPVAVAGKPQNAETGQFVFLNGKNSYDPNSLPITFVWTFASLPSGSALTPASLLNANTPKPFFTPDVSGVYTLQLIVSNGTLQSTPNTVQITVATGSLPPNANAGSNLNAKIAQTVTLNGTGSFDPNSPALSLTYLWTFETVPAGSALTNSSLTNANTAQAQFAPDVAGNFVLNLRVTNSKGASNDTTTVQAFAGYTTSYLDDVPPNAETVADQYAVPGSTQVPLNGSASSDPDNGPLPLSYNWWLDAHPSGSAAALVNPTQAKPQLAPDVTGFYIARLEATDGFASGFVNTLVTAAQKCDADANGVINQIDINLITAAVGETALPNDPRDPLGDGSVTAADLSYCEGLIAPKLPNASSKPASLTFTGAVGTSLASQTLTVTSSGSSFGFTVSTDQPWLTATPSSDNTASNTITVSVITTGLLAQTYNGNVIVTASGAGNSPFKIPVTLNLESTSIATNAGTPQIADVGTEFAVALQAIVKDANGPVEGALVTFTAPSTGTGGTFPGSLTVETALTNVSGLASAPAFTANATAGNYTVTATVDGAASPANFALTNAVPGSTELGGAIEGKSGPQDARVWIFEVGAGGPGSALGAEITSITLAQTNGAACTPVITSPASFPLPVGNIAPGTTANVDVTINFTGCASNAAFKVTAVESANNGVATGSIVRLNQFQ